LNKSVKLKRTESILREIISEALTTLNDSMLKSLAVTEVDCKRGKYDADVYLDQSFFNKEEKEYILKHLKKVRGYLENYTLQNEGWFRCPKFHFKFDDKLQKRQKTEELFSKIEKELKNDN
jgi:ribosome-binding factor A